MVGLQARSGGVWKDAEPWVKRSGAWVQSRAIFANSGGIWKRVWNPTPKVININTSNNVSATTSAAVVLPTGIVAGRLLLIFVSCASGITVGTPSGWTLLTTATSSGGAGNRIISVFYKVASGSEGSSVTVSFGSPGSGFGAISYQIDGWTHIEGASARGTSSSAIASPPPITPSWGAANDLFIVALAGRSSSVTAFPSGYTSQIQSLGGNVLAASAQAEKNAATEVPGAFTQNASDGWATATVAMTSLPS